MSNKGVLWPGMLGIHLDVQAFDHLSTRKPCCLTIDDDYWGVHGSSCNRYMCMYVYIYTYIHIYIYIQIYIYIIADLCGILSSAGSLLPKQNKGTKEGGQNTARQICRIIGPAQSFNVFVIYQGLVNVPFWGFCFHHLQIAVGDEISPIVGWCSIGTKWAVFKTPFLFHWILVG